MPFIRNDAQLLSAIKKGDLDAVKAALEAGMNANGYPEQPYPPIVPAIVYEHVGMVDVLLKQGADPDRPVTKDLSCPGSDDVVVVAGERALHIAARNGLVEIVRLLLKRSRADPNATDSGGCTPLMVTCRCSQVCVEVVQLLLEAGADPALAQKKGTVPLHSVALHGHLDLVDMLYTRAPATLNRCSSNGMTPLFMACNEGDESMVSKLLSLGAMQRTSPDFMKVCPLVRAVRAGYVGVVRIMINRGGITAVGGDEALAKALCVAVRDNQARILLLLLTVDGEEGRSEWANTGVRGVRLLHYGAGYCCPAAVSVLLAAGADEAARDPEGLTPRDAIGVDLGEDEPQMDRGKEVAIRRMLQRGPAYRARSWAWPSDEEAHTGGSGDSDTAATAAISSQPVAKPPSVTGLRIFRPMEKISSKFFVRLVGRYCAKD